MKKFISIIWLTIGLFLPMTTWAEGQDQSAVDTAAMMRNDYIKASLLIADPASEVYSVFGHCALRLQCPSQGMDYTFTFETSTDTEGVINFLRGTALGGFMAAQTENYLTAYREAGRGVTEYVLNMTPEEKLELWKTVDEEMAKGFTRRYGYMHVQCTSMVICLVNRALGTRIKYNELPAELKGSFRDLMLNASERYPWTAFFWQTILGPEGDEKEPLAHKLIPHLLPVAWAKATIGSEKRRLIEDTGTKIVQGTVNTQASICWLSPLVVFTFLLLIIVCVSLGEWRQNWRRLPRIVDSILVVFHTLLSLLLTWLVFFSTQEGTQWNWYLIAFNPIPLLLWIVAPRWHLWICRCFLMVLLLFLALTPFIPQLDLPHALIVTALAVRLYRRIRKLNNR